MDSSLSGRDLRPCRAARLRSGSTARPSLLAALGVASLVWTAAPAAAQTTVLRGTPAGVPSTPDKWQPSTTQSGVQPSVRPSTTAPSGGRTVVTVDRDAAGVPPAGTAGSAPWRSTRYGTLPGARPLPAPGSAPPQDDGTPRTLSLVNANTGERIVATYWSNGQYDRAELQRLSQFLRDQRNGEVAQMDARLFDVLVFLRRALKTTAPVEIYSAYRSPATNAWLASVSRGVARDSQHMGGNAMDIRIPDRGVDQVRAAAIALGMGGVGFYPSTGFVHIDTGPVRQW